MSLAVANIILAQLGRSTGALVLMIGAHSFLGTENSVSFRFKARARNGANGLRVVLEPSDTYTVEFVSVRGASRIPKGVFHDVYAESLTGLFERETGLYLAVPNILRARAEAS